MRYLFCLLAFLLLPLTVDAHGLVTTQSKTVGDYTIEFEYNSLGKILAGDYTLFDVYLLKSGSSREGLDYDSAFIRIQKKDGPAVIAGNLAESPDVPGYASMSGILQDSGNYTAAVSFYKSQKNLASSQFDFQVADAASFTPQGKPKSTNSYLLHFEAGLIGLLLGVAGVLWYKRK